VYFSDFYNFLKKNLKINIIKRLAEAGIIALKNNLVGIAESITNYLSRVRHLG